MSIEKDIQGIMEADVFKPASKKEVDDRQEARRKELIAKGVKPVDEMAGELDGAFYDAEVKLLNRLAALREKYGDEECECDKVLDFLDETMEWTSVHGDDGYLIAYCLRCGGRFDAW